jgi:ketosteroid isomerase-like protein
MRKMIETRKGLKINAKNTNLNVSDNGDVAWYSQLIDTCIETKGDPFRLEGFRHTGVMLKINNQWKIIQSHMSIGYEPEE